MAGGRLEKSGGGTEGLAGGGADATTVGLTVGGR
jgi:hypothetical protein